MLQNTFFFVFSWAARSDTWKMNSVSGQYQTKTVFLDLCLVPVRLLQFPVVCCLGAWVGLVYVTSPRSIWQLLTVHTERERGLVTRQLSSFVPSTFLTKLQTITYTTQKQEEATAFLLEVYLRPVRCYVNTISARLVSTSKTSTSTRFGI